MATWDQSVDFLSIGSGLAGLASALTAADLGLEALVVEKGSQLGGATVYSYGILWVPNNHLEKRHGVADSTEAGRDYMLYLGAGRQSVPHVEAYLQYAPEALEYFERIGEICFYPVRGLPDHYYPVAPGSLEFGRNVQVEPFPAATLGEWQSLLRHSPYIERVTFEEMAQWGGRNNEPNWDHALIAEREQEDIRTFGAALAGSFVRAGLRKGVQFSSSTSAERLIVEDGEVRGLEVAHAGERRRIQARRGVLLGTGMYGANPRLVEWFDEFPPMPSHHPPAATQGDGLVLAMEQGAAIRINHGTLAVHLAYSVPGETSDGFPVGREAGLREVAAPHSLLVNRDGERFADESFFEDVTVKLRAFDLWRHQYVNQPCFLVFDQQFWDRFAIEPLHAGEPVPDWLPHAPTLEALANMVGIDGKRLAASVDRFNGFVQQGRDEDFHRGEGMWVRQVTGDLSSKGNPNLGTVCQAPFYALPVFPSDTREAGLATNELGQVLHVRGYPMRGLYACGEVVSQVHVGVGYQAGFTLTGAMTFGYRAAQHAKGRS